jgi:pimeloyl-ACP methyl ester carboxylesterase
VLDAESVESVHYIGYSMGGWIGTGMALHHSDRLASLTIGGWDPIGGLSAEPAMGTFNELLERAHESAPNLTTWVTTNVLPGLEACWNALKETDGSEAALSSLGVPVLLWSGLADGCLGALRHLQSQYPQYRLLTVPGDHVSARMIHTRESIAGLLNFLERAED